MFSSLRIRLTLSYLMVIILAMGLSGLLLLSFLERYFLAAAADSLLSQAHITAQALIPGAVIQGPPGEDEAQRSRLASAYNTIQQQRQAGNLALQTENVLVPELAPGQLDLTYLSDASLQFSAQLATRIQILDTQGTVLVDTQREQQGLSLQADPLVAQALAGCRVEEFPGPVLALVHLLGRLGVAGEAGLGDFRAGLKFLFEDFMFGVVGGDP